MEICSYEFSRPRTDESFDVIDFLRILIFNIILSVADTLTDFTQVYISTSCPQNANMSNDTMQHFLGTPCIFNNELVLIDDTDD